MFRSPGKLLLTLLMVLLVSLQLAWILLKDTEFAQPYLKSWGLESYGLQEPVAAPMPQDSISGEPSAANSGGSPGSAASAIQPQIRSGAGTAGTGANAGTGITAGTGAASGTGVEGLMVDEGQRNEAESPGTETKNESEQKITERIAAASVRVETVDADGEGCGVIVAIQPSSYDVLTAAHVIEGGQRFLITVFEEMPDSLIRSTRQDRSVSVVNVDSDRDLALLRVFGPNSFEFKPATVPSNVGASSVLLDSNRMPISGWIVDCLNSDWPSVRSGEVVDAKKVARTKGALPIRYLILNSESDAGMSGGGFFDSNGNLLGIASGNGDGRAFYVAPGELQRFLRQN